jgi:rubrerythrin
VTCRPRLVCVRRDGGRANVAAVRNPEQGWHVMEPRKRRGGGQRSTPPEGSTSLADRFPDLAAEWHPTKNSDKTPSLVTPGSKYPAWWRCRVCGNEWQARVHSRTRGHGCPACARRAARKARSTPKPGESLADKFPDMAAEFHAARNGDLTPDRIGYASNKKVWWQCRICRHEWQRQVSGRTQHRSSCPRCARIALAVPKAGSSLAERCPRVAAEWDHSRNGTLQPAAVAFTTKRKAWWICSACGHKWEAAIGNRAAGAGCPVCAKATRVRNRGLSPTAAKARRKTTASVMPRPGTSFAERFPEAAAEWHPTRNDGLTPNQVGYASNRRAWWLCSTCGHEWSAIIQSRGRGGTGCPECGRRNSGIANAVPKPGRSLAERFPDLAAEWSERNHPLTPELVAAGSRRRVWWRCRACQHEWEAAVYSRASGHGCKQCAARASAKLYSAPKPGQSLADKHPELAAQWHPTRNNPLTPWDVTGTSGQKVWWRCEQGHEWEAFINNRHKAGCPKCKLWGTSAEEIRLRYELMAAGVPIDRSQEVRSATGKTLHCDMVASAWDVVIEFDGNRFHKTATGTEKDKRKTRLLTDSGWTVIRVRENLPPIGVNDVVVPLFSSELTRAKAVLEKLHDLGLKAPNHRRYMRSVEPWASAEASKHVERHPERSLATESPTLAAEWDTIKNGDLSPSNVTTGSGRKVWWLCRKCGHSWQAAVYSRARHGCPECGRSASTRTRSQRATTSRK